ncbi:myocilin-like [Hoplias malabaricus]|uniref:myocilin-like n=1 Tax=Hoplias malabaricus TaxID=27720 RepID=UPI0034622617
MWVQSAVFLCLLVLGTQGQDRASLHKSSGRSGRCQYTFTVDSPVESSCQSSRVGPEAENLSARLTLLEAVVSRVLGAEVLTEAAKEVADIQKTKRLTEDKEQLDRQVQDLRRRVEELTMEAEKLRDNPCPLLHGNPTDGFGGIRGSGSVTNGAFQEMKAEVSELPAPVKIQENIHNNRGCGELASVGEPETHQKADGITGKYGMWFQDPEATGRPYGPDTVWRINAVGKDIKELYVYENMEQLRRGLPMKVVVLPESVESTGATVYRGSLYYQRRRSPTLLRFDLGSEKLVVRRDLPQSGFHGKFPYSWGGYTDIDLAVDEQGLWAIYSTDKSKGAIVLSRLDPGTLEVTRSWETNIRKNKVANAFMICGRLYTVASYIANTTTVNYAFDTASGKSKMLDVPFHNRYRYNSMIDYNHAKKKLYSWDNFHMVTYDVKLRGL